jgi:ketosteroid isomerase-like protein
VAVETVGGVRTAIVVSTGTRRRTLDERFFVRFPALFRAFVSAWFRLPPRSRLRRALTARISRQGCESANRRDFEVLLLGFDPDFEMRFDSSPVGGFVPPDLVGVHRGHEQFLRVWQAAIEAFDLKLEHEEVIDFGDRLLAVGRMTGQGVTSGITVNEPLFQLLTLRRGMVIRQEDFVDRGHALEAARLSE